MLQTLYSTDSKGKVRQWDVESIGNEMVVTFGVVGGKMQEKRTTCKAKNVGKSNATTPEQQAQIEAKAKWTFQIDREDYHYDVTLANRQLRPMLALDYLKVPHRVIWEDAVCQPKLDGVRLTVGRRFRDEPSHEMMTRKGEVYKVEHLVSSTTKLLEIVNQLCDGRCLALDGEAYIHGMALQNIYSLVKKYHAGDTEQIEYWLFDLVIPDMTFIERHDILQKAFQRFALSDADGSQLKLVNYKNIEHEDGMKYMHGEYTFEGFEGLMIRHGSSQYGIATRSPDLFKCKHFLDEEARIIEIWEDSNGNAMFTCLQKNGKICNVTPKRSHIVRKQILLEKDEWIGKWINVKYQEKTVDGVFQFPVGLDIRDCDDDGNPLI